MVYDPRTTPYIDRRKKEGLTKKEAVRCLKRYVAREVSASYLTRNWGLTAHRSIELGQARRSGYRGRRQRVTSPCELIAKWLASRTASASISDGASRRRYFSRLSGKTSRNVQPNEVLHFLPFVPGRLAGE